MPSINSRFMPSRHTVDWEHPPPVVPMLCIRGYLDCSVPRARRQFRSWPRSGAQVVAKRLRRANKSGTMCHFSILNTFEIFRISILSSYAICATKYQVCWLLNMKNKLLGCIYSDMGVLTLREAHIELRIVFPLNINPYHGSEFAL